MGDIPVIIMLLSLGALVVLILAERIRGPIPAWVMALAFLGAFSAPGYWMVSTLVVSLDTGTISCQSRYCNFIAHVSEDPVTYWLFWIFSAFGAIVLVVLLLACVYLVVLRRREFRFGP